MLYSTEKTSAKSNNLLLLHMPKTIDEPAHEILILIALLSKEGSACTTASRRVPDAFYRWYAPLKGSGGTPPCIGPGVKPCGRKWF